MHMAMHTSMQTSRVYTHICTRVCTHTRLYTCPYTCLAAALEPHHKRGRRWTSLSWTEPVKQVRASRFVDEQLARELAVDRALVTRKRANCIRRRGTSGKEWSTPKQCEGQHMGAGAERGALQSGASRPKSRREGVERARRTGAAVSTSRRHPMSTNTDAGSFVGDQTLSSRLVAQSSRDGLTSQKKRLVCKKRSGRGGALERPSRRV